MLAQIVLTPAESKKLIAKAVTKMEVVQQAAQKGIVALHPSSSTYFIVEEITGAKPPTNHWVCGVVTTRGMCVEMAMVLGDGYTPREASMDPADLRATWIVENGTLVAEESLSRLLYRMTPSDVYIKGVNAIDPSGNVGILYGHQGSIGYLMAAVQKRGFSLLYPAGLEKLIPIPIREAAKHAKQAEYEYAMGMPVGLFNHRRLCLYLFVIFSISWALLRLHLISNSYHLEPCKFFLRWLLVMSSMQNSE